MGADLKVFLDTSAQFAAVSSEPGGARLILKLGEAGAATLWVGPWVLKEAPVVLGGVLHSRGLSGTVFRRATGTSIALIWPFQNLRCGTKKSI